MMKEYRTNNMVGHVIVVPVDERAPPPTFLLNYFEQEAADGKRFFAEETVQVGWMTVLLKGSAGGALEIWEPGFDTMPMNWRRGANATLRHLVMQQSVCAEVRCEPEFPRVEDAGIISPTFLKSPTIHLSRDESSGVDSGWVFSTPDHDGSGGEFRSLYEIALYQPSVIPFLALPSGATVTKSATAIQVSAGVEINSKSNELLRRLVAA